MNDDQRYLLVALEQARRGRSEGGVPVGAALVVDGEVLGVGHNQRVQMNSVIRHGETDCLENIGRLPASIYRRATLYTTLSPVPGMSWWTSQRKEHDQRVSTMARNKCRMAEGTSWAF
jgi:tRNA(Arg) A34 adenosine deaminase TadA